MIVNMMSAQAYIANLRPMASQEPARLLGFLLLLGYVGFAAG